MKTVLAATFALLLFGNLGPSFATEPEQSAMDETAPVTPATAASGDGQAEAELPANQAGSNNDLMKKFTRHRPGACPEGPPCEVED